MAMINTLKKGFKELADSFTPQAKFEWELMKPGVREFSLNECRVAATPEKFDDLERDFNYGIKILSMSDDSDLVALLAEKIIGRIENLFDENKDSPLTDPEREAVRKAVHEYFASLRQQLY